MSIAVKLVLAVLTIGIFGCNPKAEYIIPVDFVKYEKEFEPGEKGLTQKDSQAIYERLSIEINTNTIGRELPDIMVETIENDNLNLRTLINGPTLICISDAHCGWGIDALVNGVPRALKKAQNENIEIEGICLFIKEDPENENMEMFNSKLNELIPLYHNLFIISSEESKRTRLIC